MSPATTGTEQQLRRQFETVFTHVPVGMGVVGLDGRWIHVNAALCRITGYSESELLGGTFHDMTHPDDREADRRIDEALLSGKMDTWESEKRYLRKDGEPVWVLVSGSIVRGEDSSPQHYIAHIQDISGRKRMERELERAASGFRLARDMMCTATFDGYLQTINGSWTDVLGWSEEELRSRRFIEFVHPDDRERTMEETARFARGGESQFFRNRWERKGGGWCWMSWSAVGIPEEGLVFCAARDIGDRVEIEQALELRGEVIANMTEGVALVTVSDMRIVYANPSLERMLGHGPGELEGLIAEQVMRPGDLSPEEDEIRDAAAAELRGERTSTYEGRRVRKDGEEIWCRTTTSTFEHAEFGPVWVAVQQDITEERKAREAAAELERAKSQFFSSVSHELRTPLTSILGYTALLEEDAAGLGESSRDHIAVIERNARRQLRFVEDLLSIARIQAGEFELRTTRLDLAELVSAAAAELRPMSEKKDLELVVRPADPTAMTGDADRLSQVVGNLLTNAIKFTPDGGTIEVGLEASGEEATIYVSDSGPGVEPEERPRLFERLYRGEGARSQQISGVGLGLAISKSIVEAHSGRIEVGESAQGGARFEVVLPLSV